jgi:hypothetical protein
MAHESVVVREVAGPVDQAHPERPLRERGFDREPEATLALKVVARGIRHDEIWAVRSQNREPDVLLLTRDEEVTRGLKNSVFDQVARIDARDRSSEYPLERVKDLPEVPRIGGGHGASLLGLSGELRDAFEPARQRRDLIAPPVEAKALNQDDPDDDADTESDRPRWHSDVRANLWSHAAPDRVSNSQRRREDQALDPIVQRSFETV